MTAQIIDFDQKRRERLDKLHNKLLDTDILRLDQAGYEKYIAELKYLVAKEMEYYHFPKN